MPTATSVAFAADTVQTPVVSEMNVVARDDVVAADSGTVAALNTCVPGLLNMMV